MFKEAVNAAMWLALVAVPAAYMRPRLRPLAALVLLALLGNRLRASATVDVLRAQDAVRAAGQDPLVVPLVGLVRAEFHVMQALVLSWAPAAAAVVAVVWGQRARAALLVWLGAVVVMVLGYHHLRGFAARPVFLAADIAAFAVGVRAFVKWMWLRRSDNGLHLVGLWLLLLEGARLLAYHRGPWATAWDVARVPLLAQFVLIAVVSGGALCLKLRSRWSASESR